jgi:hypothetical protein
VAAELVCRAERPAGFCAVYVTSLAFSLPVFLFSSPYAAVAGLTIAHGLQYLVLIGLLAAGGETGGRRLVQLAALFNIALLGGAALAVASDQLTGRPLVRGLCGLFLGAVMAHFVIDAGLRGCATNSRGPSSEPGFRIWYRLREGTHEQPSTDPSPADIR